MKKVMSLLAVLVMIGGLCAGCKKEADEPTPEATKQSQESNAEDWEPETAEPPADHDDSHDGHDHGDHSGHDH